MPVKVKALRSFRFTAVGGKRVLAEAGKLASIPNAQVDSLVAQGLIEAGAAPEPEPEAAEPSPAEAPPEAATE